jgi:hypothetical protein
MHRAVEQERKLRADEASLVLQTIMEQFSVHVEILPRLSACKSTIMSGESRAQLRGFFYKSSFDSSCMNNIELPSLKTIICMDC